MGVRGKTNVSASTFAAIGIAAVAVLMLAGAVWQSVRVLGGISEVRSAILVHTTALEQLDERITREVKQRAGAAGAAKVAEERTIAEQAQAILAEQGNSAAPVGRPSRLSARRT